MKNDKIAINARFLTQRLTGVQRFATELSRQLVKLLGKEQVEFLAPHNVIHPDLAEEWGVKIVGKRTGYAWEQIELPCYLKRMGSPKLINFCNMAPVLYGNNFVAVHDITPVRFPHTYARAFRMAYKVLLPTLCRRARHIITVSEFSKGEIGGYYHLPEDKFTVVYNAVDAQFHPVKDEKLSAEHYFIAVSSMKENKNFPTVLKAFKECKKTIPDAQLYIVGDLKDKNFKAIDLSEYEGDPSIKFLGRVSDEDLIRYYSNAIAFIFPSLYEGFGIPVLEAQACGCPVISSNAASMPEVLEDSALLCEPNDVEGFAGKMVRLAKESALCKNLIEMGEKNVKRFSWEKSCRFLIEAINTLCLILTFIYRGG